MLWFKIKHFEQDHPGQKYPECVSMGSDQVADCDRKLEPLFKGLDRRPSLPGVDALDDSFQLNKVWEMASIHPESDLLLSFDAVKTIERMRREDVERYFPDIWYPTMDDLFIFDRSTSWIVYVHHDGFLIAAKK